MVNEMNAEECVHLYLQMLSTGEGYKTLLAVAGYQLEERLADPNDHWQRRLLPELMVRETISTLQDFEVHSVLTIKDYPQDGTE